MQQGQKRNAAKWRRGLSINQEKRRQDISSAGLLPEKSLYRLRHLIAQMGKKKALRTALSGLSPEARQQIRRQLA